MFSSIKLFTPPGSSALRRPTAAISTGRDDEMVGLSVILENYKDVSAKKSGQVISKGSVIKPPSSPTSPLSPCTKTICGSWFLDHCFLCKQKLLPGKDIYMYKGDKGFCSVECRCRQIFMDEEEAAKSGCTSREYNCSLSAMKGPSQVANASSRSEKGPRNRSNAFAY